MHTHGLVPTLDFDAIAKLFEDPSARSLTTAGELLGVRLTQPSVARLREEARTQLSGNLATLVKVVHQAVHTESGIAWERVDRRRGLTLHLLGVRSNGVLALGLGLGSRKLPSVFPSLEGWQRTLERNADLARRWAATTSGLLRFDVRPRTTKLASHGGEEQRLLEGIVASPNDDDARLVYADWLLERGDPRGEFIRLDLEYERTPTAELLSRRRALLEANWSTYAGELARWTSKHGFSRGLVTMVKMTVAAFEREGERLFSRHPIEALELGDRTFTDATLERLTTSPAFDRVRRLFLVQPSTRSTSGEDHRVLPISALARGTRLASLEGLTLTFCGSSVSDWSALFAGLRAPKLREVELSFNRTHPALYRGLAANPAPLTSVREYTYERLGTTAPGEWRDGFDALARKTSLTHVAFEQAMHLDDEALRAFFSPSSKAELESLLLTNASVTDALLLAIAASPRSARLSSLRIHNGHFRSDGALALLRLPALKHLALTGGHGPDAWPADELERLVSGLRSLPASHPLERVSLPWGSPPMTSLGRLVVE